TAPAEIGRDTDTTASAGTAETGTAPEPKVVIGDVVPAQRAAVGRTREDLPSDAALARAVKAQPQLTSAALALASVARFGDSAREQAEWLRAAYPKVGPERLS